jgi:predicted RND superfamily exporter protein
LWGGWVLTQPFMIATGITGCYMAASGTPLNVATAPISEIAIAAAADFNVYPSIALLSLLYLGIHPIDALQDALDEKGTAVATDYTGNWLCFWLLALSIFSPVASLGRLMLLNLTVCAAWGLLATLPALAVNAVRIKEVTYATPMLRVVGSGRGRPRTPS